MGSFSLKPDERIDLVVGRFAEPFRAVAHPGAPAYAHAIEGSEGTVFHLQRQRDRAEFALKVFRPACQQPAMEAITRNIRTYSIAPGLRSCDRHCFSPQTAAETIARHPALHYAVLIPWIQGPTWTEVVLSRHALDPAAARQLATRFSEVIAGFESRGIAHCDLAGPNVILDLPNGIVELIDVEHLYAPGFPAPPHPTTGTPGYNMVDDFDGAWGPVADRFAGAMLLGEMLGWGDPEVSRRASGLGCYFDPAEVRGARSDRLTTLLLALRRIEPALAVLFERAWRAGHRSECPRLAEWASVLARLDEPGIAPSAHQIRTAFPLPPRQPQAYGAAAPPPNVPYGQPPSYSPPSYGVPAQPGPVAPPVAAPSPAPLRPPAPAPLADVVVVSWTPAPSAPRPAPAVATASAPTTTTKKARSEDVEIVGWSHGKAPSGGKSGPT